MKKTTHYGTCPLCGGTGIKQAFCSGGTMRCDRCSGSGRVVTAITEETTDNPWLNPSRYPPTTTGGRAMW